MKCIPLSCSKVSSFVSSFSPIKYFNPPFSISAWGSKEFISGTNNCMFHITNMYILHYMHYMCYNTQFTCITLHALHVLHYTIYMYYITCITCVTLHNLHVLHYMHYMHAIVNLWDRIWIFTRADWDIVIKCYQQAHSHEGQVLRLSCHFLFYSLCCRASCESPCNGVQHLVICTISFDFQDIANVLSNSWHSPSRAGILPALTCQSLTTCGSRQCFSSLSQSHYLTISHLH